MRLRYASIHLDGSYCRFQVEFHLNNLRWLPSRQIKGWDRGSRNQLLIASHFAVKPLEYFRSFSTTCPARKTLGYQFQSHRNFRKVSTDFSKTGVGSSSSSAQVSDSCPPPQNEASREFNLISTQCRRGPGQLL